MLNKAKVKNVVVLIDERLKNSLLFVGFSECALRREDVGPDEMSNLEFIEDLEEQSDEDAGLLIELDGPEPSGAYVAGGCLYIVDQGDKYAVPLEDITDIEPIDDNTITIQLVNSSFTIDWMTQEDIDDHTDKYRPDED